MASKENRVNYFLPIFIGLVISAFFGSLLISGLDRINKSRNSEYHLNTLIKKNIDKDGKKTYLKIKSISAKIATNKKNNGYYIVSDDKYNYIVLLTDKKANELMNMDLEKNPVKIYGISKEINNDLKKIVIEKYNNGFDEKDKITIEEYYSYFGDVYLDQTLALK